MKLTMKLFLIISLFCSNAFADGDMNEGQREGEGSGGGLACVECVIDGKAEFKDFNNENNEDYTLMTFIRDFFYGLIK